MNVWSGQFALPFDEPVKEAKAILPPGGRVFRADMVFGLASSFRQCQEESDAQAQQMLRTRASTYLSRSIEN